MNSALAKDRRQKTRGEEEEMEAEWENWNLHKFNIHMLNHIGP